MTIRGRAGKLSFSDNYPARDLHGRDTEREMANDWHADAYFRDDFWHTYDKPRAECSARGRRVVRSEGEPPGVHVAGVLAVDVLDLEPPRAVGDLGGGVHGV